tara:strand:- start:1493 stop:2068 length:576 start_codon:yes stop_codon:yes gene_type:complete
MTKSVQLREKEALRKFLINRRSELGPSIDFQSNILNNIKPLIEEIENEYIGTYISFRDELDTKKLNQYLLERELNLALPAIDFKTKEINFFMYHKNTELIENKFSILEPKNKDKVIFPKIILIPLLGYSKSGFRLGYGGGYYDKYLSKNGIGDVKKIGIAFSFQEVEEIPVEDHDERLDWILTEKHLYKVQ